jgi:hypothetical protein
MRGSSVGSAQPKKAADRTAIMSNCHAYASAIKQRVAEPMRTRPTQLDSNREKHFVFPNATFVQIIM